MAYDIVPYRPELADQIAQLQTHLWSGDPALNAAYCAWKYAQNPFLDEVLIRVALCGGQAVAMRGLFGAAWEVDRVATPHLLPYADDFVVAPPHRNSGVARQVLQAGLADAARRGFPYAVNLSAGTVTFVNSLAAGWRSAGSYHSAWRTHATSTVQRIRNRARRVPGLAVLDAVLPRSRDAALFARLDRIGARGGGSVSLSDQPRPEEMAALVQRLPWDGRIRHVRSSAYLAWRYRNPLHDYRFLFWDDGGLQGYLVLQRYVSDRADATRVNIADWEGSDQRIRAGLLQAALDWGRFPRLHAWSVGSSDADLALLRERGFLLTEPSGVRARSSGLLVRRVAEGDADARWTLGSRDLLDIADWDLRMLYSMAA
jgi:GNAT superfamily N-acetyltransferase